MTHLDLPEEIQHKQLQHYQQVINALPAGVILLDVQGLILEANPEAQRLLGVALLGLRWVDVIAQAFVPKEDDGHEVSLHNGRKVKLAISPSSLGQLILITDLTETRRLQSHISDLSRLSSLGKMIASLAHQVRTPLAGALLYAANLACPTLSASKRERFGHKLMDRLHDLEKQVNDMLLFANGGNNQVVAQFTIQTLISVLHPMVENAITSQKVDFTVDCLDEQLSILGNVNTLASALSNLIINAIQAAGAGCRVNLAIKQEDKQIILAVTDNGPGIALPHQQKIMEPFFTTKSHGTGLGLSVVTMICQAHKGSVSLSSTSEKGSCFLVRLPIAKQE